MKMFNSGVIHDMNHFLKKCAFNTSPYADFNAIKLCRFAVLAFRNEKLFLSALYDLFICYGTFHSRSFCFARSIV